MCIRDSWLPTRPRDAILDRVCFWTLVAISWRNGLEWVWSQRVFYRMPVNIVDVCTLPPAIMIVADRKSGLFNRVALLLAFLAGVGLASAQVAIPPTTISAGAVNTNDLGFLVRTVGIDWPGAGLSLIHISRSG